MGYDQVIAYAAASGNLELNAFLPLIAQCLLESCDLLARGADIFRRLCVEGIEADEARCRTHVESSTATATALLPLIGYEAACQVVQSAAKTGKSIKQSAIDEGLLTAEQFDELVSPEAVCRLGSSSYQKRKTMVEYAPKGLRLHIGLFGRRNVGKSSLLNAITRQQVSIVSEYAGTTTDPVEKPMELLPLGPVLFIDTAGIDDAGVLGQLRVKRTQQVFERTELGVIVTDGGAWGDFEEQLRSHLKELKIPAVAVFNKIDLRGRARRLLRS